MDDRPDLFGLLTRLRTEERSYDARVERRLGIGVTDLAALRLIGAGAERDEMVRAVDLAGALGLTTAAVSILVDRLARAGYVDRVVDPSDGRGRILCPTDRARTAIRETDEPVYGAIRALTDAVSDAEAARFAEMLDGLSRILEGGPPPR
ncbi:MarR family transcriptional regulator [Rathayibacter sp. VKM Ac-2760]|uniref:MarR family winged helix-turn-helix transcriptional regulator n=1 Tax=Rathayibacter sp. VKM Ac-2760 TaxID=2609253 RepID=UPI00131708D8|nr:MarR family transcriptional regulator [Rathayibacter sp. VKM Ac-2760]QHC57325.1 MarR family transcriptional regulator [Rathayibacter sp. VKM Ac-2760]